MDCGIKKKILFLNLNFFEYDNIIANEMKRQNYEVVSYCILKKYSTKELFLNRISKSYEKKILDRFYNDFYSYLDNCDIEFDIIFAIGCAHLRSSLIHKIKEKYSRASIILYYWDDLERACPDKYVLEIVDKVYTFDREDSQKYRLIFRPLFYGDVFINREKMTRKYDLSFIGTLHSDRGNIVTHVLEAVNKNRLQVFLYLRMDKFRYIYRKLRYSNRILPYLTTETMSLEKTSRILKTSKVSLDIPFSSQKGLTMRTIECLGAETKIITTNWDIVNYDFYCPENIMVIDRDNPQFDLDFFDIPYKEIEQTIINRYSISSWVKDILSEEG